ncbi:hypothetical protein Taro_032335 [Colocasia esculenta]|uniref:Uncharacterized protein n=1 Tax=Colocasia esculenta TaxID=4460 RepID=A0A843W1M6_COLES|nr:hypothetical protein [Colocasia esculenta]
MGISEEVRAKAEVYYGDELGQLQTKVLLQEAGMPRGLLPLLDIVECGYLEETGFVWVKQKKKVEHCFDKVGRTVSYAAEITAYVEEFRIRKLTGVKVKELMLWLTLSDISVDGSVSAPAGKLTCKTSAGLFRVFPASAFELPGNPPRFPRHPQLPPPALPADQQQQQQQDQEIKPKLET